MGTRGRLRGFDLVHLLLVVTVAELAFNRLAVPALRPPGETPPPGWHQVIDHAGLFLLYFASALAVGVLLRQLWQLGRNDPGIRAPLRWGLIVIGAPFAALAVYNLAAAPGQDLSFAFETLFTAILLLLLAVQLAGGGDLGIKVGLVFLIAPLVIHYYGPFALRFIEGPEALWGNLPERVRLWGHWSMVFAALVSPYCFAPRPFVRSAARLAPLGIALFVGVLGAVILRQHYEVGMLMASRGLGVELGPGAPSSFLALNLLALATITWTMTACFTAETVARREVGVGLALVVLGGYGFTWPLQYLVGLVGLVNISQAAQKVGAAERGEAGAHGYRAPPIADEVWQGYVRALVGTLRGSGDEVHALTSEDDHGDSVTRVRAERRGIDVEVTVTRSRGAITAVDIRCGAGAPGAEPEWTLHARPERLLGMSAHPEPPASSAPVVRTGDLPFDQRFRIRDAGGRGERLLDEGLRARATALIDGWVAFWPGRGLRYQVQPGYGAPLDHPIPITELSFRGVAGAGSGERLVTLIDLLVDITARGLD
jgi:hypothetical protein